MYRIRPLPLPVGSRLITLVPRNRTVFPRSTSTAIIFRRMVDNLLKTAILPARHKYRDIGRNLAITRQVTLYRHLLENL